MNEIHDAFDTLRSRINKVFGSEDFTCFEELEIIENELRALLKVIECSI